ANGGVTGFADAQLNVIAGQPNKAARGAQPRPTGGSLRLTCWPMDITSTHPRWDLFPVQMPERMMESAQDVIVTGLRRTDRAMAAPMAAPPPPPPPAPPPPEDVGDLKLYHVPVAVDV